MRTDNKTKRVTGCVAALAAVIAMGLPVAGQAQSFSSCGNLNNAYGPFDYTNPVHFREKLPIVEKHHYDLGVQMLKGQQNKPNGAWNLHNDLDYTLRAFPNHHRALYTMVRYYLEKQQKSDSASLPRTPECYFDRAMRWRPDDATVRMIYGLYLHKVGMPEKALERYEEALTMAPDSSEIHYNIGLLYASRKEYEQALEHAHKAYELGYPLPGLRNKLKRAGAWQTKVAESE